MSSLDRTARHRSKRLGLTLAVGLLLVVSQTSVGSAEPPADGALRLTFDGMPDCATKTNDLTFTLTKTAGTEDLTVTITRAELTVGTDPSTDPGFTPTDLGPGVTEAVATPQVALGQGVSLQVAYTVTQRDGTTSSSNLGLAASSAPLDLVCPPSAASTSTTAPPTTTTTTPHPTVPPSLPADSGTPPPAQPVTGGANFTG